MAKKKKQKPQPSGGRAAPAGAAAVAPAPKPAASSAGGALIEALKHPTLILAWISAALSVFAAAAAVHFRDKMEMGAIREPTGAILCAAIAITLFASYYRERLRAPKTGS